MTDTWPTQPHGLGMSENAHAALIDLIERLAEASEFAGDADDTNGGLTDGMTFAYRQCASLVRNANAWG